MMIEKWLTKKRFRGTSVVVGLTARLAQPLQYGEPVDHL
jgi:hypothetical protein